MSLDHETWVATARSVHIEDELARRGIKLNGKNERAGPCPKCGGGDRFSINIKKQVFNCRGCGVGGDVIALVRHLDGVGFIEACTTLAGERPKANGKDHTAEQAREVCVAAFSYTDESGALLFMVARIQYRNADGSFVLKDGKPKKNFRQKRPDPNWPGQWIYNVDGVRVVPYKLPELLKAIGNDYYVLIVEGEAKVDFLHSWNVPATCNAMGAGKWKSEHSEFLRGADVVILPDNDQPGRDHADSVGASLQGVAKSVRVLELSGLAPKQDIIDWAQQGGTVEKLHDLIAREAKPWTPRAKTETKLPPLTVEEWSKRDLPKEDLLIGYWMSTTSRVLFSADTGLGKTNWGMAAAGHLGAGIDFLHWHIPHARRCLFIDGEMSARLLRDRIADVARRLGCIPPEVRFLSHEDVKDWQPLNTEAGQRYIHEIITQTGVEAVFFDNVMALILGDMKDEEAWRDTLPLVMQLTTRRVGQLWLHHTGHDASRSYGTKTREWRMDTVIHGTSIQRPDADVSFQLEFKKARGRRPETRQDFQTVDIALVNDKWVGNREAAKTKRGNIPPVTQKFFDALQNVFAGGDTIKFQSWKAATMDQWRNELRLQGLVDKAKPAAERSLMSRHRIALIAANYVACNNDLVWIV